MPVLRCKVCGEILDVEQGHTFCECENCKTVQTIPLQEKDYDLFNKAARYCNEKEFDKAAQIYEELIEENPGETEAYWGLLLSRYGVVYSFDENKDKINIDCTHYSNVSIFDDENFNLVMKNADFRAIAIYAKQANEIEDIRKKKMENALPEESAEIYICCLEKGKTAKRSIDSYAAQDVSDALKSLGYKVFFPNMDLSDMEEEEREGHIFSALQASRIMIIVGTRYESFTATKVRNEWSRYLRLVKEDTSKNILVCYKNCDVYSIPQQLNGYESFDLSRKETLARIKDKVRGILSSREKAIKEETEEMDEVQPDREYLELAEASLKDGDFDSADEYFDYIISLNPENEKAYLGKLLAKKGKRNKEELLDYYKNLYSEYITEEVDVDFDDEEHIAEMKKKYYVPRYLKKSQIENQYHLRDYSYNSVLSCREKQKEKILEEMKKDRSFSKLRQYAGRKMLQDLESIQEAYDARIEEAKKEDRLSLVRIRQEHLDLQSEADEAVRIMYETAIGKRERDYLSTVAAVNEAGNIAAYEELIRQFTIFNGFKDSQDYIRLCQERIDDLKKSKLPVINEKVKKQPIIVEEEPDIKEETVLPVEEVKENKKEEIPIEKPEEKPEVQPVPVKKEEKPAVEVKKKEKKKAEEKKPEKVKKERTKVNPKIVRSVLASFAVCGLLFGGFMIYRNVIEPRNRMSRALELMNSGKYDEAIELFTGLGSYSNASYLAKDARYRKAMVYYENGDYKQTIDLLTGLNHLDSEEIIASIKNNLFLQAEVGDTILFGSYEQDNNTSNGHESIEWIVLDKKDNQLLLLSKNALDVQPFDSTGIDCSWEDSSLRFWLNNRFPDNAFTNEKVSMIQIHEEEIASQTDAENTEETEIHETLSDHIFLLNADEVVQYFPQLSARLCSKTAYAAAKNGSSAGDCDWWLRSSEDATYRADYVQEGSGIIQSSSCDAMFYVRPAMWIKAVN